MRTLTLEHFGNDEGAEGRRPGKPSGLFRRFPLLDSHASGHPATPNDNASWDCRGTVSQSSSTITGFSSGIHTYVRIATPHPKPNQ